MVHLPIFYRPGIISKNSYITTKNSVAGQNDCIEKKQAFTGGADFIVKSALLALRQEAWTQRPLDLIRRA